MDAKCYIDNLIPFKLHDSPLLFVFDNALDAAGFESIITAAREHPANEVTMNHKYRHTGKRTTVTKRTYPEVQTNAIQAISALVHELLQCPGSGAEPTVHFTEVSEEQGLTLGLHVDTTNGKPRRFATGLLYLNDVPAGSGGETVFPAGAVPFKHPTAEAGKALLIGGSLIRALHARWGGGSLSCRSKCCALRHSR